MSKNVIRMSKEQMEAKLTELRAKAEDQAQKRNEALNVSDLDAANEAEYEGKEAVDEYNTLVRKRCFAECKAAEDPMLEAVKRMTYEGIAYEDKKGKDDDFSVRKVIPKAKKIDLLRLHEYCGGIGKDTKWRYMVERMCALVTINTSSDIESAQIDYPLSDIARTFNFSEEANMKSVTSTQKAMQIVVNAMIGDEYKVYPRDANYLRHIWTEKGKGVQTVRSATLNKMAEYMLEVCNRIVTNGVYKMENKDVDRAERKKNK